jgi:hypothetical protein
MEDCLWFMIRLLEPTPVISYISSLHLTQTKPGDCGGIFSSLTLPALRNLSIRFVGAPWAHADFMALRTRSHFQLERLSLVSVEILYNDLVSLLQALPSLIEIEIDSVHATNLVDHMPIVDDNLLELLTYNMISTNSSHLNMLPRVQTIKLWGPHPFSDNTLVNMIQSRWQQPPPNLARLQYVGLKYHRPWDVQEISRLEKFREEELELFLENFLCDGRTHFRPGRPVHE